MARYVGPSCRLCRAEKVKLFLKGTRCFSDKCPIAKKRGMPGRALRARMPKVSDYGLQLREKQKLKRMYCMLESQFKLFFDKAVRMPGVTGENLIGLLERRLDNVVYRMNFASSRNQARQIVGHGHVLVNGKAVNIPSYLVKPDDVVEIKEKSKNLLAVKESLKEHTKSGGSPWLEIDPDKVSGKFNAVPRRSEISDLSDVKEQLIVELYSK